MLVRIALDLMGGDFAPAEILQGAKDFVEANQVVLSLVGSNFATEQKEWKIGPESSSIWVSASEKVGMKEIPSLSLRKKDSSIQVGLRLLKEERADAFVSAGNTGAIMAASMMILGRVANVKRPPLIVSLPKANGFTLLVDAGASVDCTSQMLLQYAALASSYLSVLSNNERPRIALLSVGEEEEKGNALTKEVYNRLKDSFLNFVGNVEGKDLLFDVADIVLCDGFVGNITLKTLEGAGEFFFQQLKNAVYRSFLCRLGALLLRPAFRSLRQKFDYSEVGGAPLLGVNGCVIICHGRSKAKAIRNALVLAKKMAEGNLLGQLRASCSENTREGGDLDGARRNPQESPRDYRGSAGS